MLILTPLHKLWDRCQHTKTAFNFNLIYLPHKIPSAAPHTYTIAIRERGSVSSSFSAWWCTYLPSNVCPVVARVVASHTVSFGVSLPDVWPRYLYSYFFRSQLRYYFPDRCIHMRNLKNSFPWLLPLPAGRCTVVAPRICQGMLSRITKSTSRGR